MEMITIAACESQPIVVEGLRRSLEGTKDLQFVGAVSAAKSIIELVEQHKPSVCLIDKAFGTKTVFQLMAEVKALSQQTEPILWAAEISEILRRAAATHCSTTSTTVDSKAAR